MTECGPVGLHIRFRNPLLVNKELQIHTIVNFFEINEEVKRKSKFRALLPNNPKRMNAVSAAEFRRKLVCSLSINLSRCQTYCRTLLATILKIAISRKYPSNRLIPKSAIFYGEKTLNVIQRLQKWAIFLVPANIKTQNVLNTCVHMTSVE